MSSNKWNNEDEYEDEEQATAPSLSGHRELSIDEFETELATLAEDDDAIESAIEDDDDRELHPFNILVNNKSGLTDDLTIAIKVDIDDLLDVCDNLYPQTPWDDLPLREFSVLEFKVRIDDDFNKLMVYTAYDGSHNMNYILTIAFDDYDDVVETVCLQQLSGRILYESIGAIEHDNNYQSYVFALGTGIIYHMSPNPDAWETDYQFYPARKP